MHQTRPMPAHLHHAQGQESNISFSISQILSPGSEASHMEDDASSGRGEQYPTNGSFRHFDESSTNGHNGEQRKTASGNGYLYPQFGNYWNGDFYNQKLYNSCRLGTDTSSIYYGSRSTSLYSSDYSQGHLNYRGGELDRKPVSNGNSTYTSGEFEHKSDNGIPPQHLHSNEGEHFESRYPCNEDISATNGIGEKNSSDITHTNYNDCRYNQTDGCQSDGLDDKRSSGRSADSDCSAQDHRNDSNDYCRSFSRGYCTGSCCSTNAAAAAFLSGVMSQSSGGVGSFSMPPITGGLHPSGDSLAHQAAMAAVDSAVAAGTGHHHHHLLGRGFHHRSSMLPSTFPWMESRRERIACKYLI